MHLVVVITSPTISLWYSLNCVCLTIFLLFLFISISKMSLSFCFLSQVKVLYVRNLMLATTELRIEQVFSQYASVERVKKIRDYAFVHFLTREGALKAMKILNGILLVVIELKDCFLSLLTSHITFSFSLFLSRH